MISFKSKPCQFSAFDWLAKKTYSSSVPNMFGVVLLYATFWLLSSSADARDITFPPISGIKNFQKHLTNDEPVDIVTGSDFSGLVTFANLPYANCFKASDMDAYDIAILGAPFDTVSLPANFYLCSGGSNVTRVSPLCVHAFES